MQTMIAEWKQTSHPSEKKIRALVRESSDLTVRTMYIGAIYKARCSAPIRPLTAQQILEQEFNSGFLEFSFGELEDPLAVRAALSRDAEQIRLVIHSAAQGGDWGRWEWFYNANYLGTKHVIDHALHLPNLEYAPARRGTD
jgi:hypothetical protein